MICFERTVNFDLIDPAVEWTHFPFDPKKIQGRRFLWTDVALRLRHLDRELPAAGTQEAVSLAERFMLARDMTLVEIRLGEGDGTALLTLPSDQLPTNVCWNDKPQVIEAGEKIAPRLMFHGPTKRGFPPEFSIEFWLTLRGSMEPV